MKFVPGKLHYTIGILKPFNQVFA